MATVRENYPKASEPLGPTYVPLDQEEEPDDPATWTCEHKWALDKQRQGPYGLNRFLGRYGLSYTQCTKCDAFKFAAPPGFEKEIQ